nr:MAG TPA: hypothetical protein [Caudoviricetes sp.]
MIYLSKVFIYFILHLQYQKLVHPMHFFLFLFQTV